MNHCHPAQRVQLLCVAWLPCEWGCFLALLCVHRPLLTRWVSQSGCAVFLLMHRLEHGDTEANIEADVHKAVDLYLQAAALGNATAQFVAGVLHATGLFGVPHDEARAVLLYHQAALGGNVKAQMTMG